MNDNLSYTKELGGERPQSEKDRRSPYAYYYNNPIRFIDLDGMRPDKYFDENGNYLGDDKNGRKIRVIEKAKYDELTKGKEAVEVASELKVSSTYFSQSTLDENQQLKVYDYFNPTTLPLASTNKGNIGMVFEVYGIKSGNKLIGTKEQISVKLEKNALSKALMLLQECLPMKSNIIVIIKIQE